MSKILLDYVFPIVANTPIPQASTSFLKQACIVAKPKSGQEGNVGTIFQCVSMAEVEALTDNDNAEQLFSAGLSKVYILLADDLDVSDPLSDATQFFTVLISDDFDADDYDPTKALGTVTITSYANLISGTPDAIAIGGVSFVAQSGAVTLGEAKFRAATSNDATAASLAAQINGHATVGLLVVATVVNAIITLTAKDAGSGGNDITVAYTDNDTNVGMTLTGLSGGKLAGGDGFFAGTFKGVVGITSDDEDKAHDIAIVDKRVGWYDEEASANNMCFAFGSLLANPSRWLNQQYIDMPEDGVSELGTANTLFDDKVSFVITDDEFAKKLALFAAGGIAIVAPYILKNLMIDLQSAALTWINTNQPDYTVSEATLLEDQLQVNVINKKYIETKQISSGKVEIKLINDNFVATGSIVVTNPRALWRVAGELTAQ